MEYSIDELKKRKTIIETSFKDLYQNIIENQELKDLNINEFISEEFLKTINTINIKHTTLMNEE